MPLPVLAEIYMTCAIIGALVLVVSAVLGGVAGHTGAAGHAGGHAIGGHTGGHAIGGHGGGHAISGHGGGHAISGHGAHATVPGGHAGGAHAAGQGTHTAGPSGHGAAGHPAAAHGSQSGPSHASSGQPASAHAAPAGHGSPAAGQAASESNSAALVAASSRLPAVTSQQDERLLKFVALFNPTTLSAFSVWFGAFGLFSWRLLPFVPIELTVPIAVVAGLLGTKFTMFLMGLMVSRMYTSGTFSEASIIGAQAEVTVAIAGGHTGEVTCVAGGSRLTSSARALNPDQAFKPGEAVIISDVRDDIAYVERWPDDI